MSRRTSDAWLAVAMVAALWAGGVVLVAVVANVFRWGQGETVLVLDNTRGWGLHRMDIVLTGVAVLPGLLVALGGVIRAIGTRADRRSGAARAAARDRAGRVPV